MLASFKSNNSKFNWTEDMKTKKQNKKNAKIPTKNLQNTIKEVKISKGIFRKNINSLMEDLKS